MRLNLQKVSSSEFRLFLDGIAEKYPPQTQEEEQDMCRRLASTPKELTERLILHNITFAMSVVKDYSARGFDKDDINSASITGLVRAAADFDPSLGNRFATFAYRYILTELRKIIPFDSNTNSTPIANLLTVAVLDAPLLNADDAETCTVKDFIHYMAVPDWMPPSDADIFKALDKADDYKMLISFIVETTLAKTKVAQRTKDMIKSILCGASSPRVSREYGISAQRIRWLFNFYKPKIVNAIRKAKKGSELYYALERHNALPKMRRNPEAVYKFLIENHISIAHQQETEEQRVERLMTDFDDAVSAKKEAMGRFGNCADFDAIRLVYERHVRRENVNLISKHLGMPKTYVAFLRNRGVQLVREYLDNIINQTDNTPSRLEEIEQNVLQAAPDNEKGNGRVSSYNRMLSAVPCRNTRKSQLETTFYPYSGGFYTQATYNRLRYGCSDENKMTRRQIEMFSRLAADFSDSQVKKRKLKGEKSSCTKDNEPTELPLRLQSSSQCSSYSASAPIQPLGQTDSTISTTASSADAIGSLIGMDMHSGM